MKIIVNLPLRKSAENKVENKFIQNENLCEHIFILILLQCVIIKIKFLENKNTSTKKLKRNFSLNFFGNFPITKKRKKIRKTVLNKFIYSYAFILEEVVV